MLNEQSLTHEDRNHFVTMPTPEDSALARTAVLQLIADLPEEDSHWFVLVTTPDIVKAVTGQDVRPGAAVLYDRYNYREMLRFRMRLGE